MQLPPHTDALIVGAGPIGLACAISARRRGLTPLVIDAGVIVNSIADYPVGMTFFTTSERLEIGGHPLTSLHHRPSREEALAYYRGVVRAEALDVRTGIRLVGAAWDGDAFRAELVTATGPASVRASRLVLATGYFDHPNLLDVPGESLPHVRHYFEEPHRTAGQHVVIVGGKNSAIEAALLAFRAGAKVTLIHRAAEFKPTVKYWLRPDFDNRVAAGEISARMSSTVTAITPESVEIIGRGGVAEAILADRVYLLTGYHPDFTLLRSLGVALDPESGRAVTNPETLESNVPGLYLAGSVAAGRQISEVFIENGRLDGEKIFGDPAAQRATSAQYAANHRPVGE
jgi:thioredoxin reductase (NADPH)